ncbi:Hsp70 family protein [Caloramator sp. Dgby_cultured_2]|nr:Hsp70 family protein [Caloramator sp. Dgby_cultured_2]WDU84652.1 Hsp70 family protein [Caloramator sp. Dgby_cultured_2]
MVIENVYSNGNIIDFKIKISREEFEEMVFDLVGRAGYIIDKALEDKDLSYDDIDLVLMVGGTTRIPLVRKYVKEKLNKDIKTEINPDEAVALGAAIQAAIMSGKMDEEKGLMITDICPYNLGVASVAEINGQLFADVFSKIIERNTTIPTSKSKEFYTLYDNQTEVEIKAYQTLDNDCLFVDDATFIGSFHLSGIPENKAGKEAILVEFSYDLNGNIKITATIKSNGISKDLEIKIKAAYL